MSAFLEPYTVSLWALVGTATLTVIQLLVADFARGHAKITPGKPIEPDHALFAFRADRAHANSIENLSAFALLSILAILVGAHHTVVNVATVGYVGARVLHMLLYYADQRALRPTGFGLGILATLTLAGGVIAQLV